MSRADTRPLVDQDLAAVQDLQDAYAAIRRELAKCVVGQDDVLRQILIAVLIRGHCLLEGVPGLGKTLLVSSLASTLSLHFQRIQFTPDLMPSDITGAEILMPTPDGGLRPETQQGPIFCNMLLADEINRTPPKTQAALLEAMQERQVTIGKASLPLPAPFFVLATQNPIEQEGTYPLPEAQLDRFVFKIHVDYPSDAEEQAIMRAAVERSGQQPQQVLDAEQIVALQAVITKVPVPDAVYAYAARIVRASRPGHDAATAALTGSAIEWGAGPRASIFIVSAAQALAVLEGRYHVAPEDIRAVALPVLRHRLGLKFEALAAGRTPDDIVAELLGIVGSA